LDDVALAKAAIVPIPNGRNPLTRRGRRVVRRAWRARDWDAAVPIPHRPSIRVRPWRDGIPQPPSVTTTVRWRLTGVHGSGTRLINAPCQPGASPTSVLRRLC